MSTILSLAPQNVWKHFYSLTQVPVFGLLEEGSRVLAELWKKCRRRVIPG